MAFDPGSSFALKGRELGGERGGGGRGKGESEGPEGVEVRGERLGSTEPFALPNLKACLDLIQ